MSQKKTASAAAAPAAPTETKISVAGAVNFVQIIVTSILHVFNGTMTDKNISDVLNKAKKINDLLISRKLKPEIEERAATFLYALLANNHVLNMTDQQIDNTIDQAIAMAKAVHKA